MSEAHLTHVSDPDLTIACVGDSALWCTGTRYQDKTPNLVHLQLTGEPIPPVQFRPRGGAVIGVQHPFRVTHVPGSGEWKEHPGAKEAIRKAGAEARQAVEGEGFTANRANRDIRLRLPMTSSGPANYESGSLQFTRNGRYLDPNDGYYGFVKHDAADWYTYYNNRPNMSDINQIKWTVARDIGWGYPRIVDQLEQFPRRGQGKPSLDVPDPHIDYLDGEASDEPPYAENVDVLILNGGTNDINLNWLNNPIKAGREAIMEAARLHLYEDQVELLRRARERFPNAVILDVGYYPFASDWTDRRKARDFLSEVNIAGNLGVVAEAATDNALNLTRFQSYCIRRAVAEAARDDDGPGIVFVPRRFSVINAFDAPEPYAWGYPAVARDDTGKYRAEWGQNVTGEANTCHAMYDRYEPGCTHASIGHPNRKGCQVTADAVVERYADHVRRSVRDTVEPGDDNSGTSLRDATERYSLDPEGEGLRYCLSHYVVDSIRVEIKTGGNLRGVRAPAGGGSRAEDPRNDVYLRIEPGRSGFGERFRLETEYDDFRKDAIDVFYIDPMMGAGIDADIGPIPETHGMSEGAWAYQRKLKGRSHDSVPFSDADWQHRDLELTDIDRISLQVVDTDPWALKAVTIELNGFVSASKSVNHGPDGLRGDHDLTIWQPGG